MKKIIISLAVLLPALAVTGNSFENPAGKTIPLATAPVPEKTADIPGEAIIRGVSAPEAAGDRFFEIQFAKCFIAGPDDSACESLEPVPAFGFYTREFGLVMVAEPVPFRVLIIDASGKEKVKLLVYDDTDPDRTSYLKHVFVPRSEITGRGLDLNPINSMGIRLNEELKNYLWDFVTR